MSNMFQLGRVFWYVAKILLTSWFQVRKIYVKEHTVQLLQLRYWTYSTNRQDMRNYMDRYYYGIISLNGLPYH